MEKKSAVVKINPAFVIPSKDEITEVRHVSGENLPLESLDKHPEWSGMKIIITGAERHPGTIADQYGEIHDFVVMSAFIFPTTREPVPGDVHLVSTGANNVFKRVSDCIVEKSFPVSGGLRKSGRAWFLD